MLAARMLQLGLSPVLAAQAAYVICTTPRLPEPEGARHGVVGQGARLRLLIIGDSSAAGVGAKTQSEAFSGHLVATLARQLRVQWQLIAWTGLTTAQMPQFLQGAKTSHFDIAVTALGVNDVTRLVSPKTWRVQTRTLHDLVRRNHGVQRIYATTVPPLDRFPALPWPLRAMLGRQADALRAALDADASRSADLRLITPDWGLNPAQMARDGFHPGPEIYRDWGRFAGELILADLQKHPLQLSSEEGAEAS